MLAVECCRRSLDGSSNSVILPRNEVDWALFLRLARYHRIEGLVWKCLAPHQRELPVDVGEALRASAAGIAANNLRVLHECRLLLQGFEGARIPLLFLKGLPLGAIAYGNPAIKSSIDIDLLIDPEDLLPSATILRGCGYRQVAPADSHRLVHWHRGWKESVWRNDRARMQIDLHTRTADNPRLIPSVTVHSPSQHIEIGEGRSLPTLADEEQFAYLVVHGASSAWFRLKWIADLAGFLSGNAERISQLYDKSQELGAGRAAGQALMLADELFEALAGHPDLRAKLDGDRATVRLFRTALGLICRNVEEPTSQRWGTLPIHSTQMLLLPGLGYKLSEAARQTRRLLDRLPG